MGRLLRLGHMSPHSPLCPGPQVMYRYKEDTDTISLRKNNTRTQYFSIVTEYFSILLTLGTLLENIQVSCSSLPFI